MNSRRYRCARWLSMLLAGAGVVLVMASHDARAESYANSLRTAIHDVADLLERSVERGRSKATTRRLDEALRDLVRVNEHHDKGWHKGHFGKGARHSSHGKHE